MATQQQLTTSDVLDHLAAAPAQEAVAELSAAVIARVYGAAQDKRSHDYMAHYGGGDALGLCMQVLARVEKVLALIFDHAGAGAELEQQAA